MNKQSKRYHFEIFTYRYLCQPPMLNDGDCIVYSCHRQTNTQTHTYTHTQTYIQSKNWGNLFYFSHQLLITADFIDLCGRNKAVSNMFVYANPTYLDHLTSTQTLKKDNVPPKHYFHWENWTFCNRFIHFIICLSDIPLTTTTKISTTPSCSGNHRPQTNRSMYVFLQDHCC